MTAHLFSPAGHRNSPRLRNNEMLGRIDRFDWQRTPLGPIAAWPEALRAATRLMLCASAPIAIIAGRDGWFILNDAMRETLGLDCDAVLGRSVLEALPRAAPFYREVIARCAAGEAPRFEDQPLALLRGRRTTAWFNLDFAPVLDVDGNYLASMVIASETTARVHAERALQRSEAQLREMVESADAVALELDHRIKNMFAPIDGLIGLSLRDQPEMQSFAERLHQRLMALSQAHDFIRPVGVGRPTAKTVRHLVQVLLSPYNNGHGRRILIEGADVEIDGNAVTPLTLVFHELATNSAKYGALAVGGGTIGLVFACEAGRLRIDWKERAGCAVRPGAGGGFGSRLITMMVEGALKGALRRNWEEDGVHVEIELPLDRLMPLSRRDETR
jgi:PAS domain S-box-containing protein